MRISDWSSDVCSSDLRSRKTPGKRRISAVRRGQGASGPASNLQNQYRQSSGSIVRSNPRPEYSDRLCCKNRSEEHTSELQSLMRISYAVFCLKNKLPNKTIHTIQHTTHYTVTT